MSKKNSKMMIKNSGGTDFEPDPVLDPKGDYEARIVGVCHIGIHEQKEYSDSGPTGKILETDQVIVAFELTEEETFVERGPEDNKELVPRIMYKFMKYSSHENSNFFKIAASASPEAAFLEGKEGCVDPVLMVNEVVQLKLSLNKDKTKNNIKSTAPIAAKYKKDVPDAVSPLFCYSVDSGACVGKIGDVTPWLLSFALDNAVNSETFEDAENLEEQIEKNNKAKEESKEERTKLEGDDKPKKAASKRRAKKVAEPEEDEEEEDEVEKEKPSRRSRKGRSSKKSKTVDYSDKSVEEMENILIDLGVDDDAIDVIADEHEDDEAYLEALIARANKV